MKRIIIILLLTMSGLAFLAPNKKITIFLIGDSTMANKPLEENPERGWGQLFPEYFTNEVEIQNHAVNGRSTKSFMNEHRWDTVMKRISPGDYVLIQFGHNDSKMEDSNRYAPAHTMYKENLIRFVTEARTKGAIPILITPVMRRKFDSEGKFVDQHGEYPGVVREVATLLNVPLIDLHKSSEALIVKEGVVSSRRFFLHIPPGHFRNYKGKEDDNTHFSEYGASSMASLVCRSILDLHLPIAKYLKTSDFKEKYAFELPKVYVPHFKKDTFNIMNYGAVADGFTLNSQAINKAIEACASKGGGTVLVPKGSFVSGPILFKSNINLHLAKGALILFSSDFNQYPLVVSAYEGVEAARCQSPVTAEGLENIAITGEGILDGNGYYWRPLKKEKVSETEWKTHQKKYGGVLTEDKKTWYSSEKALKGSKENTIGKLVPGKSTKDFEDVKDFLRPNMIRIVNCKNILIEGVTFENSPAWTTHINFSEHVTIRHLTVKNPWYGTNTDGIDLDCSKNVLLENSSFDTGDDGICIKSGRDEEGRKRGVPTEDVIIRNCTVYHAHGGFVVGSEMSGGVRNMFVSNCTFIGTDVGLRFKTARGRGGIVENIYVSGINMKDIIAEAILFDMYYMAKDPVVLEGEKREPPKVELRPVDVTTPQFSNFYLHDITCNGAAKGIFIRGIPEMHVKNVWLANAMLEAEKGVDIQEASNINLEKVSMISKDTRPLVYLLNSDNININDLHPTDSTELLLQVQGERTNTITLLNCNLNTVKQKLQADFGAKENVVNWTLPFPEGPDNKAKKIKNK